MLQGPLRPLAPTLPLRALVQYARPLERLGAWVSGCAARGLQVRGTRDARGSLLLSQDLGFLLSRCGRVVVRQGEQAVALASDAIIRRRAIQVATATPYLPGTARLKELLPGLRFTTEGFLIPMGTASPEEVLALCIEEGVRINGSRIMYAGQGT